MFSTRPLVPSDQDWLWDILHVALWDPPPAPLRPRAVLEHPAVRIYAENWGRPTDVGVVGQLSGVDRPIGAAWMRLIANQQGLAYVDDDTPQIGIALFPEFQHQGHGRPLMLAALAAARVHGYKQVALTVHPENPAIKVYERCGFTKLALRSTFHLMLVKL
ncbi:MAG: GNAT family N-acetyltransferase [Verrucomicrobiota bacterium]|nr:GNAT family N-acetyltransferase [Verrucomicrobiota bacterium]